MKKLLLCGALSLSLLIGGAAAFSDISDKTTEQAAAVLDSLEIMQGTGGNRFNPNANVTRAEFAKLAVTSLGVTDISTFKNYTVFPDVPSSHWAAGYINAAMRHNEITSKQIIRGFADGTFGPEKNITYGEVCTMLLRMLGYTVDDVGPYWPADYIAKAEALSIDNGANSYGPNDYVTRGDTAILLLNALQATPKEGDKLLLLNAAPNSIDGGILLATSETDSTLRAGEARFYESGSVVIRPTVAGLGTGLIGTRGTILFDKTTTNKVKAFAPENVDMETIEVRQAFADRIETSGRTYKIARDTSVVLNGELLPYSEAWFDLTPGFDLNLVYDSSRQIELISTTSSSGTTGSIVYGITSTRIPDGYEYVKNGVSITSADLKKYDLVSLDSLNMVATVSDRRVTGMLESAYPSFYYPERIRMLGREFIISEQAASYFSGMKYEDKVTLLLDRYGNVQAAYPASKVSASMVGVLTKMEDGHATVSLLEGLSISGEISASISKDLLGQMVSVSVSSPTGIYVSQYKSNVVLRGTWDVAKQTFDGKPVSSSVRIYERVADNAPVTAISIDDILTATVPSSSIYSTITDSSGAITAIILNDYTGNGWSYGIGYGRTKTETTGGEEDEDGNKRFEITNHTHTVTLTCFVDGESTTIEYNAFELPQGLGGNPVGIPTGMENLPGRIKLPVKQLSLIDTVTINEFDGNDGVITDSGYFRLADDIGVYINDYKRMIPLREAKVTFNNFRLYSDSTSSETGVIRVIVVP